jgi:fructose-1-phosphate kinase PfkB-like protein
MQKTTAILVWETLKPQEDGIKKSGRTEQSGYQFKNTEPSLQAIYRTTPFTIRPAGREIDQTVTRKTLKKITNAIRKTHNCTLNDEN